MSVAGKVAITLDPYVEWSAEKTYDKLVAVRYQNKLYISRKSSTNVLPTDNEYWMLAVSGAEVETMTNNVMGVAKPDNDTITVKDGVIKAEINKELLDKLGESDKGTLTFDGSEIKAISDYVFDTFEEAEAAVKAGLVEEGATVCVKEDSDSIPEMNGATADTDGRGGAVPAPKAGQENHVLKGNGAWEAIAYDSELSAESENAPQTKVVEARAREIETNLAQLSNPNLLINPDFRINQRGQTSWSGKDQYTVDRWRQFIDINGTITKDDDGLIFDNTNGKISLGHFFENPSDFAGKTVTLSAKIMKLSEDAHGSIYIGGNNLVLVDHRFNSLIKDEWVTLSITYTMPSELTNMIACIFVNDDAQTKIKVNWVKLELGSIATPFVPPDPASELLKCQRYGDIEHNGEACYKAVFSANKDADGYYTLYANLPVEMRTVPTVAIYDYNNTANAVWLPGVGSIAINEVKAVQNKRQIAIKCNNDAIAGKAVMFGWIADAEIYY